MRRFGLIDRPPAAQSPTEAVGLCAMRRKGKRRKMEKEKETMLLERINKCPFNAANGIHALRVEEGFAEIAVTLTEKSKNAWGVPHGGLLFSLADVAAGLAAQALRDGRVVTVSANVNFIRAARGTSLRAVGKELRSGRSVGFFDASVFDENGELLLAGQYVMHYSDSK